MSEPNVAMEQTVRCNICGSTNFKNYAGRQNAICVQCKSVERHRSLRYALETLDLLKKPESLDFRILHLAPEPCTYNYLSQIYGALYCTSDRSPEYYPHARCMKLAFPDDFSIFPNDYFDLVIHNHVLEHIPGSYVYYFTLFHKLLKKGGRMLFTIPVYVDKQTSEGGEYCASEEERKKLYGQEDHLKVFGKDFTSVFDCFKCKFTEISPPIDLAPAIGSSDIVYCYEKL